ncbi:MAG: intradiol ring-cleavage dioxygenase [Bacteroidetes bacterium]|nr:intradiol ring-cleavage dioxygenase [Bacteroidota bacterium]
MRRSIMLFGMTLISGVLISCYGQPADETPPHLLGRPANIAAQDTSPLWNANGERLLITGTVYASDGMTPVPGAIIYYYQTNTGGVYPQQSGHPRNMPPNAQGHSHGHIRGWAKSDRNGVYKIYTVRPGAYPGRDEPAHIHLTVSEPGEKLLYYIDDVVFDDDRLMTTRKRLSRENRAGSGIVRLVNRNGLRIGERNIILGLNIPDHPSRSERRRSGRSIGEEVYSFTPHHAWGEDKGSRACPVCKYGRFHGALYFVGNHPDWTEIRSWLRFLETESVKRGDKLKVYFVYGNENGYSEEARTKELEALGKELRLEKLALTFVPSFLDTETDVHLNKIDQSVENTFILYKRSNIIGSYADLRATPENFRMISDRFDQTINEYFEPE